MAKKTRTKAGILDGRTKAARDAKQTKEFVPAAQHAARFTRGGTLSLKTDLPLVERSDFTEVTDEKRALYLQAVSQTPRLTEAARMAGISPKTAYLWREAPGEDPAFDKWFPVARRMGLMRAESELWRRGIDGYEKPVYHQGQLVGTERVYSDTAAIFMLKGALPDTYRDRQEISGPGGGPVALDVYQSLPDAELHRRAAEVARVVQETLQGAPGSARDDVLPAGQGSLSPEDPVARYAALVARRTNGGNGGGG